MMKSGFCLLACSGVLLISPLSVRAEDGITAVFSRVSGDYSRARSPDGSFQSEGYAFGKGGFYGAAIRDDTIDNLAFSDVAHVIAVPLAAQNYLPSRDPRNTKLLIMVYWGATDGSMDFSSLRAAGGRRNGGIDRGGGGYGSLSGAWGIANGAWGPTTPWAAMTDTRNASILGYIDKLTEPGARMTIERADLIDEVEYSRYFVVLMAYDFQLMWKHKEHKLLWESRFSVREQGNDFTVALPAMAQFASEYFGRDSHGLLRTRVPDGRIYMGDPTVIGYLSGQTVSR
jgi:hypothetical protein